MTRLTVYLVGLAVAATLLATTRCSARRAGILEAQIAALDSALAADRQQLAARAAQLTRDSLARVAAERQAVAFRARAAAERVRSDSLDRLVRVLDSTRVVVSEPGAAAGDTIALPPLVIRDLLALRSTVVSQAAALQADTAQIHRLEAELATSRAETAAARRIIAHQDERAAVLDAARPRWYQRLGRTVVRAGTAAGCGAIGAVVGGPAGAAIGAGACVLAAR